MLGRELLPDDAPVWAKGYLMSASSKFFELAIEPGPVPKCMILADFDIESCGKLAPLVNPVSAMCFWWLIFIFDRSFNRLEDSPSLIRSSKSEVSIAFLTPSSRSRSC